ncbi:uncharacterized protein LOC144433909 [Glandiceps talaboti]
MVVGGTLTYLTAVPLVLICLYVKTTSAQAECPSDIGMRTEWTTMVVVSTTSPTVINKTFVIDLNEDFVACKGTTVILNSTISTVDVNDNLCVNRTIQGSTEVMDCIHTVPSHYYTDYTFKRLSLEEFSGYWVLRIEDMQVKDDDITYTWWFVQRNLVIGETYIQVPNPVNVQTVEGKTTSVCVRLSQQTYIEVGLKEKTKTDIYTYESENGYAKDCFHYNKNIYPSNSGNFYITVFKNVTSDMTGEYTLTATRIVDGRGIAESVRLMLSMRDTSKHVNSTGTSCAPCNCRCDETLPLKIETFLPSTKSSANPQTLKTTDFSTHGITTHNKKPLQFLTSQAPIPTKKPPEKEYVTEKACEESKLWIISVALTIPLTLALISALLVINRLITIMETYNIRIGMSEIFSCRKSQSGLKGNRNESTSMDNTGISACTPCLQKP